MSKRSCKLDKRQIRWLLPETLRVVWLLKLSAICLSPLKIDTAKGWIILHLPRIRVVPV